MPHDSCQSSGGDKNWTDFVTAIEEGDESRVRSILLETDKGAPHPFLARKIRNTQVSINLLFQLLVTFVKFNVHGKKIYSFPFILTNWCLRCTHSHSTD